MDFNAIQLVHSDAETNDTQSNEDFDQKEIQIKVGTLIKINIINFINRNANERGFLPLE